MVAGESLLTDGSDIWWGHQRLIIPRLYTEFLLALMRRPGTVITYDAMLDHVYGHKPECDEPNAKIFNVVLCKLRRLLRAQSVPIEIETVWGRGWRLVI